MIHSIHEFDGEQSNPWCDGSYTSERHKAIDLCIKSFTCEKGSDSWCNGNNTTERYKVGGLTSIIDCSTWIQCYAHKGSLVGEKTCGYQPIGSLTHGGKRSDATWKLWDPEHHCSSKVLFSPQHFSLFNWSQHAIPQTNRSKWWVLH